MPHRLASAGALTASLVAATIALMFPSAGGAIDALPVSPHQQAQVAQPAAEPQNQGDEGTLVLPKLEGPRLPPAPPAIESPNIPYSFRGCWEGDPDGFDWVATDPGLIAFGGHGMAVGGPGKITFCYSEHQISVPNAEVRISVAVHALDVLSHLGLGFSTFAAHGISTDLYAITPTRMRARTDLVVVQTDHWLYVIPAHSGWPSEVDWTARLTGPDAVLIEAQQIILNSGLRTWGGWHAVFHRVADMPP
jgi:hypothetical protein